MNYRASVTNSPLVAISTVPGVQQTSGRLSIGGGLPAQVEVSIDGISVVELRRRLRDLNALADDMLAPQEKLFP